MFSRKIQIIRKPRALAAGVCAVACAAALAVPTVAFADEATSKQAEAEAALQSLNTMMARLDEANANYTAALEAQDEAEKRVEEAQDTIDQKTAEIEEHQEKLGTRARSMYRTGGSTFIDVLFGSATFDEFATNMDMLNTMNEDDANTVAETKTAREELEAAKAELEEQSRLAAEKTEEAAALRDEANQMASEMQTAYSQLSAEATALLAAQGEQAVANGEAGQTTQVAQDQIVAFDEATGTATLSDGTTAKVVGYDSNTGNAIVDLAMSFVGGNYQWGASDAANSTFDCSGLVQYVYGQSGIAVGGHNDRAILNAGTVVTDPQPGDICWWDGHVAIYTGNGMMVSADNEQYGITYREVSDGATYVRY